jgi:hypothetical protein
MLQAGARGGDKIGIIVYQVDLNVESWCQGGQNWDHGVPRWPNVASWCQGVQNWDYEFDQVDLYVASWCQGGTKLGS